MTILANGKQDVVFGWVSKEEVARWEAMRTNPNAKTAAADDVGEVSSALLTQRASCSDTNALWLTTVVSPSGVPETYMLCLRLGSGPDTAKDRTAYLHDFCVVPYPGWPNLCNPLYGTWAGAEYTGTTTNIAKWVQSGESAGSFGHWLQMGPTASCPAGCGEAWIGCTPSLEQAVPTSCSEYYCAAVELAGRPMGFSSYASQRYLTSCEKKQPWVRLYRYTDGAWK